MRFHLADVDMTNRWDNGAFRGEGGGDFDSKEGEEVYTYLRILSQFCSWY